MKNDLARFGRLYDQFDADHGQEHIHRVRDCALKLGEKYLPDKLRLVYIAATLHDIGLIQGRAGHEAAGAEMALEDKQLQQELSPEELKEVADAIREHRASTGNPQSVLAKIISDADKVSDSSAQALKRAFDYGTIHFPELDHEEQIWRSATHLLEKFGPGGTGTRTYFPESRQMLAATYEPIFKLVGDQDRPGLRRLLDPAEV